LYTLTVLQYLCVLYVFSELAVIGFSNSLPTLSSFPFTADAYFPATVFCFTIPASVISSPSFPSAGLNMLCYLIIFSILILSSYA
jgi:hypothetical protein